MTAPERRVGDRAFAVDAGAVTLISVAICLVSDRLAWMSVIVPLLIALRLALWLALPRSERDLDGRAELAFFALATLIGGFNDWNSVTRHRIYDYTVPTDLPGVSDIPIWMLLYWGLILRFVITVFHWRRTGIERALPTLRWRGRAIGGSALRVAFLLGLTLVTRQSIYRLYEHPIGSWLPFLLAIGVGVLLLGLNNRRLGMLGLVIAVGPLVEMSYINVGNLHAYHLGWLGGVPLWIALWWGLAALVWEDVGTRVMDGLERLLAPRQARGLTGPR